MLFKKNERLSDSGEERGWENPELILFDISLLLDSGSWDISGENFIIRASFTYGRIIMTAMHCERAES